MRRLLPFLLIAQASFGAYAHNVAMTVQAAQVTGTISAPLLVCWGSGVNANCLSGTPLATLANGGYLLNGSGYDFNFGTASGCASPLKYERISQNLSTGAAQIRISATVAVGTIIYLCAGDASIVTDQSNASGLWTDFSGQSVLHMEDSAANTTVTDSSGNSNTFANVANTSGKSVAGIFGNALTYNGSSDKSTGPNITALNNTQKVTFYAWVKPSALTDYSGILDKYTSDSHRIQLSEAGAGEAPPGTTDNTMVIGGSSNGDSSSAAYVLTSTGALTTGAWHQLVMVFDGSQAIVGDRIRLYHNGSLNVATGATATATLTSNANAAAVVVGNDRTFWWTGVIDEVYTLTSALSAAQISALYNNESNNAAFWSASFPSGSGVIRHRVTQQ